MSATHGEDTVRIAQVGPGELGTIEAKNFEQLGAPVVAGVDVEFDPVYHADDDGSITLEDVKDAEEAGKAFINKMREEREKTAIPIDVDQQIETYGKLEEAISDDVEFDAVSIANPHTLHAQTAFEALENGYHVFVEKPIATDTEDAVNMQKMAEEEGLVLQVGYQRQVDPVYEQIKDEVGEHFNTITGLNWSLDDDWLPNHKGSWRVSKELSGGGDLYDSGSHMLDFLLWATESTPKKVYDAQATYDVGPHDVETEASFTLDLERDNERFSADLRVNGDHEHWHEHGYITGEDADGNDVFLVYDHQDGNEHSGKQVYAGTGTLERTAVVDDTVQLLYKDADGFTPADEADGVTAVELDPMAPEGGYFDETLTKQRNFVNAVREEEDPRIPGDYGVLTTAVTESFYDTLESDQPASVQDKLAAAGHNDYQAVPADD